jgi:hypothetical protein
MVTRVAVTSNLNHWMYAPLRALVKLAFSNKHDNIVVGINTLYPVEESLGSGEAAEVKTVDGTSSFPPTSFGDTAPTGAASTALAKAVKNRVYGLVVVFVSLGADFHSILASLKAAVYNADDMAVALLLKAAVDADAADTPGTGRERGLGRAHAGTRIARILASLPELLSLARSLRFQHIAGRLEAILHSAHNEEAVAAGVDSEVIGSGDSGATAAATVKRAQKLVVAPSLFNEYFPYLVEKVETSSRTCIQGTVSQSGYSDLTLLCSYYDQGTAADSGARGTSPGEQGEESVAAASPISAHRMCAVDSIDIASISVDEFVQKYVVTNQPVRLVRSSAATSSTFAVGSADSSSYPQEEDAWAVDSLLQHFGRVADIASTVPYATLFGHKEVPNQIIN